MKTSNSKDENISPPQLRESEEIKSETADSSEIEENPDQHLQDPDQHLQDPDQHLQDPDQHLQDPDQHLQDPDQIPEQKPPQPEDTEVEDIKTVASKQPKTLKKRSKFENNPKATGRVRRKTKQKRKVDSDSEASASESKNKTGSQDEATGRKMSSKYVAPKLNVVSLRQFWKRDTVRMLRLQYIPYYCTVLQNCNGVLYINSVMDIFCISVIDLEVEEICS